MRYVNLTTLEDSYQAYFVKKALEDEGIRCIVVNENSSNMLPLAGPVGVVIQVRVVEADFMMAQNILNKLKKDSDTVHCPNCNSTNVTFGLGIKNWAWNVFVLFMAILFWVPVAKFHHVYSCKDCGTEFRKSKF